MKLTPAAPTASFYESFSDLIFATLAIFVLLMIIFLVHINLDTGEEELIEQLAKSEAELEQAHEQQEVEVERNEKLKKSQQSLKQYNLEIVIAVDTTGSMQPEIDLLADTISLVGKILPRIANSVKIGVLGYRRDESDRVQIQTFPMQRIADPDKDGQRSFKRLHQFVRGLRAQAGSAPLEMAVDGALKMFSSTETFTGHQTLMLLGDVGPYEDRYRDQKIDARNEQHAQAMQRQLGIWAKASLHRNVLVLFTGNDEIAKTRGAQHQKFVTSKVFFEELAAAAGQPDGYSDNYNEMIPLLLATALN